MIKFPSNFRIRNNSRNNLEPHEVFLDHLAQQREREIPESEHKLERPLPDKAYLTLLLGVLLVFGVLIGRSFWFQIVQGEEHALRAQNNQFVVQSIRAERGVIYDQSMKQLVYNRTTYRLVADPSELPSGEAQRIWLIKRLAEFTGLPSEEIAVKIETEAGGKLVLQEDLDYEQVILWETKREDWPGISLERQLARQYSNEGGLSHLLGYVSRSDFQGAAGLESYYDGYLRDRPGQRQLERDAQGRILEEVIIREPEPGDSLVLNIDYELQSIIEDVLKKKMEEAGSQEANAVAIDPRNGAVRALVSFPGYDNNVFSRTLSTEDMNEVINQPDFSLFNQAISGIGYATGSVIKPLLAVAALEEGIIDPDRQIYAPEKICIPHAYTGSEQCFHDWRFHGWTDLRKAIASSVNVYFYMIGGGYQEVRGLGPNKIIEWLGKFGWNQTTGIDLPNEGKGVLPEINQNWRLGNTYHLSIGQGHFSVTPLQVAVAYAALANGGVLYQPQVVNQIIRQMNGAQVVVREFTPIVANPSVASYENIKIVQEGMRQAVTSPQGSTYLLNSLPVTSAAKTGTAQTGRDNVYHNWIALFAPYEDPELVMVFMIRDVHDSMVAVRSVAYDVLDLYFSGKNDKFSQNQEP